MADAENKLILITRPAVDADIFAVEVRAAGFEPLVEPMLGIVPTDYKNTAMGHYAGLVFTSANAVRVFGVPEGMRDIPVFAVGTHTAEEARRQGYRKILSAEGDGGDLAALIKHKLPDGGRQLLHIRGEHTALPLEDILKKDKIRLEPLIVYTAKTQDHFSRECREALQSGDLAAVTFFSRRTAENFMLLAEKEGLFPALKNIKALCLSDAVLKCVQRPLWAEAYAASRPDRVAMLELLQSAC